MTKSQYFWTIQIHDLRTLEVEHDLKALKEFDLLIEL